MINRIFSSSAWTLVFLLFAGCGNGNNGDNRSSVGNDFILANPATAQVSEPFVFAYSGDNGPGFWYEGGHPDCLPQEMQSPVNITDTVVDAVLAPIDIRVGNTPIFIENNGHGLEFSYQSGSSLTLNGVSYLLDQLHFHTLSEHTVEGERPVMEMHFVCEDPSSGELAVVARHYEVGAENPFLANFSQSLPQKSGDTFESPTLIDATTELTGLNRYYTYMGSLTTPPCSNIVTWFVLKERSTLSEDQYDAFRAVMGNNFRPLQKISGRVIRETAF
jgi:carbonic anhydrase